MSSSISGHCNCGKISVTVEGGLPASAIVCSCTSCRRSGGTTASVIAVVDESALTVTGTPKTFEAIGSSGAPVVRWFCGDCGSPVKTIVTATSPSTTYLKLGLFEPGVLPPPAAHLFKKNFESWQVAGEGVHCLETQ